MSKNLKSISKDFNQIKYRTRDRIPHVRHSLQCSATLQISQDSAALRIIPLEVHRADLDERMKIQVGCNELYISVAVGDSEISA